MSASLSEPQTYTIQRIHMKKLMVHNFCISDLDDICAVLKLDNVDVGHSKWKGKAPHCWNEKFNITLDKVGEVIQITYYNLRHNRFLTLKKKYDNNL